MIFNRIVYAMHGIWNANSACDEVCTSRCEKLLCASWDVKTFFLICIVGGGVKTWSTRHVDHLLAYCTCPGWLWGWRIWWNEWQGQPKYSVKICPDATLSTTNPTWPDPGLNPGRRGGKPATNCFSCGVAKMWRLDTYTQYFCFSRKIDGFLNVMEGRTEPL
jgi:hypothetical protein